MFVRRQNSTSIILLGDPFQVSAICHSLRPRNIHLLQYTCVSVRNQSINSFRGAGNSVYTSENNVSDFTLPLTISHRFGAIIAEVVTRFLRTIYRDELGPVNALLGANTNPGRVLCSSARDDLIRASRDGNTIIMTRTNNGIIREAVEICTQLQDAGVHKQIALVKGPILDKTFERIKSLFQLRLRLSSTLKLKSRTFNAFEEVVE